MGKIIIWLKMQWYFIKHPGGKIGKENNFLFIACFFFLSLFEFHTFRTLSAPCRGGRKWGRSVNTVILLKYVPLFLYWYCQNIVINFFLLPWKQDRIEDASSSVMKGIPSYRCGPFFIAPWLPSISPPFRLGLFLVLQKNK